MAENVMPEQQRAPADCSTGDTQIGRLLDLARDLDLFVDDQDKSH